MQNLKFDYKNCLVPHTQLQQLIERLGAEQRAMHDALDHSYVSDYAFCKIVFDTPMHAHIKGIAEQKRALGITAIVIIGIGGSNLGARAVAQALYTDLHNQLNPAVKIYYADTVDAQYLSKLMVLIAQEFQAGGSVLINIVSKSGSTLETEINRQLFVACLQHHVGENYHKYIVVTTDRDSALWYWGQENRYTCLEVPARVGGRFSIFSAVGLFPLAMLGVDIDALVQGAQQGLRAACSGDLMQSSAAVSAAILYYHYRHGKNIHDTFLFSVSLEHMGKWYRQLMGESIGKEYDRVGNRVQVGITPTVSMGSIDLHSVAQLYLAGPHDKITTFIDVQNSVIESFNSEAVGNSLPITMHALLQATCHAYQKRSNPFMNFTLPQVTPFFCGQLMQILLCQMVYVAALLEVNPFDQPNVELYKKEARRILGHE